MHRSFLFYCIVLFEFPLTAQAVLADNFWITTAVTSTNGGHVLDGSDRIVVTRSGSIDTSRSYEPSLYASGDYNVLKNDGKSVVNGHQAHFISATGNYNTLSNTGRAIIQGYHAFGLTAKGDDNLLENSGEVSSLNGGVGLCTAGDRNIINNSGKIITKGSAGIFSRGNGYNIKNSGIITTTSYWSDGVYSSGQSGLLINEGTVVTNGDQSLGINSDGYYNTVVNAGEITTIGDESTGINASGGENTLLNSGIISTSGSSSVGIRIWGNENSLRNSGKIHTQGESSYGIKFRGRYNYLVNSGTLTTEGDYASGVFTGDVFGYENTFENNGSVSTKGIGAHGIYLRVKNDTVVNRGVISTSGTEANGIRVIGAGSTINSSGIIDTNGDFSHGIFFEGGGDTLNNTGRITTNGAGADGILRRGSVTLIRNTGIIIAHAAGANGISTTRKTGSASAGQNSVTNGGTVVSNTAFSISMEGSKSTLDLLAASVLVGDVHFAENPYDGSSTATLNFGLGLNAVVRIDGLVPTTINAPGNAYAISGNLIYAVDPTGFVAETRAAGDLARMISGAVFQHRVGSEQTLGASYTGEGGASPYWGQVIGGLRSDQATSTSTAFKNSTAGLIVGRNSVEGPGFFLGTAIGHQKSDVQAFDTNNNTIFAGFYQSATLFGMRTDLSLSFGGSRNETKRNVANNTVENGIEHTRASYNSYFISPAITLSSDVPMGNGVLTPSFGLLYAAIQTKGYTESGSTNSLKVADRMSHLVDARAQLNYSLAPQEISGGILAATLYGGAAVQHYFGDDVTANVPGASFSFPSDGESNALRGFVGVNATFLSEGGARITGGLEVGRDNQGSTTAFAHLLFNFTF